MKVYLAHEVVVYEYDKTVSLHFKNEDAEKVIKDLASKSGNDLTPTFQDGTLKISTDCGFLWYVEEREVE